MPQTGTNGTLSAKLGHYAVSQSPGSYGNVNSQIVIATGDAQLLYRRSQPLTNDPSMLHREPARRDQTYVEDAKAKRIHPGALAVLQYVACLNLASSYGNGWEVPEPLLHGLHQFCTSPRDVIATDFALTQICPTRTVDQSSTITLAAKPPPRGSGCESGKARAAWLVPIQRARSLDEFHEVSISPRQGLCRYAEDLPIPSGVESLCSL